MQALGSELRTELQTLGTDLRGEMKALGGELRAETKALGVELRTAMDVLHERQGIRARALFEEALSRIAAMNEARWRSRKPKNPDDGGR